jgi:hypothetical protein
MGGVGYIATAIVRGNKKTQKSYKVRFLATMIYEGNSIRHPLLLVMDQMKWCIYILDMVLLMYRIWMFIF